MVLAALLAATAALAILAGASAQVEQPVEVVNDSTPTRCAEEDNVYIKLRAEQVRRFRIEARHPAYIGTIVADRWAPDFANCTVTGSADYKFERRRLTLYETEDWQLVGLTFPSFWRPNSVPVRVGQRTETGFHLLQLWTRFQERAEEVLVLYPADGYWRARPLAPQTLRSSAYGSSFLVGPVEVHGRPLVDIRAVTFDPATRTFTLAFARGGSATLRLDALDQERIELGVTIEPPIGESQPFAALRSMYVTETNSDVAQVAWREQRTALWGESPVMSFKRARAVEFWAGRRVPSRHNTSAPDFTFRDFATGER
ncbi:MAG: hypothetical protein AB7F22_08080 [Reyranella sp.]|uniref:hypothetical protein n=1 Tax=Reyranella sp. TaxID=1929291 RepID=UPI003D12C31A